MAFTLQVIVQNSDYSLKIFTPEEITALEIHEKRGKPHLYDFANGKERPAKPEEDRAANVSLPADEHLSLSGVAHLC